MLGLQRAAGNRAIARYVPNLEVESIGPSPSPDVIRDSRDPRLTPGPRTLPAGAEVPGIVACYGEEVEPVLDTAHHWIEMGDESYGWWPATNDVGGGVVFGGGVPGILNGTSLGGRGTSTTDPHHNDPARRFSVVVTWGSYSESLPTATRQARDRIRSFARSFSGNYTWNPAGTDCHEFVADALEACGLAVGPRRP